MRSLLAGPRNGTIGHDAKAKRKLVLPVWVEKMAYKDKRNPAAFPTSLWQKIFVECADGKGILNLEQQKAIIQYARNRSNIASEKQSQMKGQSHQKWKILDRMGCLTYELRVAGD